MPSWSRSRWLVRVSRSSSSTTTSSSASSRATSPSMTTRTACSASSASAGTSDGAPDEKGRPKPPLVNQSDSRSALRELEAAAGFLLAVLLALDDARVAGQEALLLEGAAQLRLVIGERLREAVAHGAGLAREAAARDRDHDVVLVGPVHELQGLLEDHAQDRTREIDVHRALVHRDRAAAGLDPDAGDRVLALAGRVGAPVRVEFLDVLRGFRSGGLGGLAQIGEGLQGRHGQALTFLALRAPTSSVSGC